MASPTHSKVFAALKALQKDAFATAMRKSPRELFSPETVYGAATQDRAIALVAASNLDIALEHAIKTHLVNLSSEKKIRDSSGLKRQLELFLHKSDWAMPLEFTVVNSAMTSIAFDIFGTPLPTYNGT